MRKLWISLTIAFACLAVFVCISQYQNNTQDKVSKPNSTDSLNKPTRIVSLAPNLTEILFALGLGEKIAAVSNDSDYPPEAANKKRIGTFWQPNTEAIIASKPDLVVTLWFEQQKSVADSLNRLGYEVLTLKIEKIEELLTTIQNIGTIAGCRQRSDELAENISTQLDDLKSKLSSTNKVKVLWVVQLEPLRVAGRNTFINELIKLAGGENAIGPTLQQYPPIGSEEILACGAAIIIQSAMGASNIAEQQQTAEMFWSRWANLPAVKNNRIYVVEPDTTLRLGPRLPQGIKIIARCLHPDIFTETYDPVQQTRQVNGRNSNTKKIGN
jgi:iron complex transport system substrate-binding protein